MLRFLSVPLCLVALVVLTWPVSAEVPRLMNYQGRLLDDAGLPVNATADLSVTIFEDQAGTTDLWNEVHSDVVIENGLFSITLGEHTALPAALFNGQVRYLGVQMDGGPVSTPLVAILSAAYSLRSGYSDTAGVALSGAGGSSGWVDEGTRVHLASEGDSVGIGTSSPRGTLDVVSSGTAIIGETTGGGTVFGVMGGSNGSGTGVLGTSNTGTAVHGISISGFAGTFYGPKNYFSGNVGIGVTDPGYPLEVEANATAIVGRSTGSGYGVFGHSASGYGGYFVGPRSYFSGDVGIGTINPDERLHVLNSGGSGARAFLTLETTNPTSWGECGLRFKTPANTWHFRMDDYTNNNLPIAGSLSLRSQTLNQEVMTWASNGRVGIGDTSPDAKLDVVGDFQLSGAYRGNISSSSGSDGAPFPRPAYNSGWQDIGYGDVLELSHNLGGDPDDYVVDLQFKTEVPGFVQGIHIYGHGMFQSGVGQYRGMYYTNLTSSVIQIYRPMNDIEGNQVRVRIWVIN